MIGSLRRGLVPVLAGALFLPSLAIVPAHAAAARTGVVSAPLPPGKVSAGLPKDWRPARRPTQEPFSSHGARARALAKIRAEIKADQTRPHRVAPLLPSALRADVARIARARARHLIGPVR